MGNVKAFRSGGGAFFYDRLPMLGKGRSESPKIWNEFFQWLEKQIGVISDPEWKNLLMIEIPRPAGGELTLDKKISPLGRELASSGIQYPLGTKLGVLSAPFGVTQDWLPFCLFVPVNMTGW